MSGLLVVEQCRASHWLVPWSPYRAHRSCPWVCSLRVEIHLPEPEFCGGNKQDSASQKKTGSILFSSTPNVMLNTDVKLWLCNTQRTYLFSSSFFLREKMLTFRELHLVTKKQLELYLGNAFLWYHRHKDHIKDAQLHSASWLLHICNNILGILEILSVFRVKGQSCLFRNHFCVIHTN